MEHVHCCGLHSSFHSAMCYVQAPYHKPLSGCPEKINKRVVLSAKESEREDFFILFQVLRPGLVLKARKQCKSPAGFP